MAVCSHSRIAVAIISSLLIRSPRGVELATIPPSSMSRRSSVSVIPNRSAAVISATCGRGLRKMRRMTSGVGLGMIGLRFDLSHRINQRHAFVKVRYM